MSGAPFVLLLVGNVLLWYALREMVGFDYPVQACGSIGTWFIEYAFLLAISELGDDG